MPNKSLSFLSVLLVSVAFWGAPALSQDNPSENNPTPELAASILETVDITVPEEMPSENQEATSELTEPVPEVTPEEVTPPTEPTPEEMAPSTETVSEVAVEVETEPKTEPSTTDRQLLEAELADTSIDPKNVVDFPSRPTLDSLELAPLPGIRESLITGPTPMGASVSTADLPSEQLLGRITTEVFQEMADIERTNIFLKLQMQKEQLKNDLEKLKATYRQTRLEEIEKREDVVRNRIQWWQEQEQIRLEIEKKKAEELAIEQQIAESEALRDKLHSEALEKGSSLEATIETTATLDPSIKPTSFADMYTLLDIKGTRGNLTARLKNNYDDTIISVQKGDALSSGHIINDIKKDTVYASFGRTGIPLPLTFSTVAHVSKPVKDNSVEQKEEE